MFPVFPGNGQPQHLASYAHDMSKYIYIVYFLQEALNPRLAAHFANQLAFVKSLATLNITMEK